MLRLIGPAKLAALGFSWTAFMTIGAAKRQGCARNLIVLGQTCWWHQGSVAHLNLLL
jgi:hypothetical protein